MAVGILEPPTETSFENNFKAKTYTLYDKLGTQKNWLFNTQTNEHWIGIDNFGRIFTDTTSVSKFSFNPSFRFSAGPLPVYPNKINEKENQDFIVLIHCVESDQPIKDRVYYHRFVYVQNKQVVSFSDAFHFEQQRQVEYSCGMAFLPTYSSTSTSSSSSSTITTINNSFENRNVLITYSIRDKTSDWGIMQFKDIIRLSKQWEFKGDNYKKQKIMDGIL
jgi:hypothetical protein